MNVMKKILNWKENNEMYYNQIKKMIIVQFAFSVLLYIVLITNELTNHYDGLWNGNYYLASIWELSLGRWVLPYTDRFRIGISSEPLTSCLTLSLIIVGTMLICDIFGQIGKKTGYIAGMIILSNTTICNYLSYRFTSPTFGISFALSILTAWLIVKKSENNWGAIAAAIVTAFGLGSYQANLACTCVILIIVFIKMQIDNADNKKIIDYTLKSIFALAAGCIIYKFIWSFHLVVLNISPSSYNGADSISIKDMIMCIPQNIVKTYKIFISYFFLNDIKHNIFQRFGLYYIVFAVIITGLVAKIVTLAKKSFIKTLLVIIALAILPMACNASLFLATKAGIMIQMTAGMTILFPVIFCFFNSTKQSEKEIHIKKYKFMQAVYTLLSVVILYGGIYMTAIDQETMYQGKNASETLLHEVVSELRERQILDANKTYLFMGRISDNPLFKTTKFWDMANAYARFGEFWSVSDCLKMTYDGMLRNIGVNLTHASNDDVAAMMAREDIQNMPVFPAKESIQEIDGYIVIKMG